MKIAYLVLIPLIIFLIKISPVFSKDFVIFSIAEEIPMGTEGEKIKKNYYLNIGQLQGVGSGATLDVYRNISRLDPYSDKTRYYFKIKIGELEVLHSEENASIAMLKNFEKENNLLYEINAFMIGDEVNIHGIKTKTN
ncbi:MAG: hypothetical protein A2381_10715 [Bdellovibrionales bacterium RIFOXYB1_FULL_37_110]|nr:MAG: hypothetical protein A2181_06855 [Bdellovibrionales bacterium RIFOXYA1_FULL_38_20]OFZ51136.1 MAG: hypothetical protein A2417_17695 [Bdellovibrionales bacterium RIFOXYC1_FULL_37_79]OFZ61243.1 MAG: hypothetical protein A2381_10715 [Bdellovibrionales bacterium RIFOXYB1_FULL_37_110]OFZ62106.1 MAG: hypothetical protein A2577_14290 [Bdellovibrionales bacterium RIFOXYD1_FULL_36_51]